MPDTNNKVESGAASKSVMWCAEICRICVSDCINCIRTCMASKYANTQACKDCMEACHHCVAVCEYCAVVCESGSLSEIEKACKECIAACQKCAAACQKCAESCPDCKDACSVCAGTCDGCYEVCQQLVSGQAGMAMKLSRFVTVKAVGEWELDVTAVPFIGSDSDGQWFDGDTDVMADTFTTPLIVYQHGIKQGAKSYDDKPVVVGKSIAGTLQKLADGWHVRVLLDKTKKLAKEIMEAAKKKLVAVSSGSIPHLARLEVNGKLMQYEKDKPGRIAVWPLGEISLWEMGNGNVSPASRFAVALPVMKAMYREAGIRFPDVRLKPEDTGGGTEAEEVKRRARVKKIQQIALKYLDDPDKGPK